MSKVNKEELKKRLELSRKIEDRAVEVGYRDVTDMCRENDTIKRSALSDFKYGRIKKLSYEKVLELCKILKVSPDFFCGDGMDDLVQIRSESYVEIEKKPSAGDSDEWLSFLFDIVRGFDEDQINDLRTYAEFLAHKRESK